MTDKQTDISLDDTEDGLCIRIIQCSRGFRVPRTRTTRYATSLVINVFNKRTGRTRNDN